MTIKETNFNFDNPKNIRKGKLNGIVLHHADKQVATVEQVHSWHLANGWEGIGYHFYVRKDGTIYRGRPENYIGAHTTDHNSTKLGICAEGDYEVEEKMPVAQKKAIVEVLKYLYKKYGVLEIYRHKNLGLTACPGKNYPFDEIIKSGNFVAAPENNNNNNTNNNNTGNGGKTVNIAMTELSFGDKGYQVKTLQRLLHSMKYDLGANPIDGIFGGKTEAAVKKFQGKNGLGADGIVGVKTWSKLLKG